MYELKDLLKGFSYSILQGAEDREVSDVVYDSRKVVEGSLFVCIKGTNFDAHDVAGDVVAAGKFW